MTNKILIDEAVVRQALEALDYYAEPDGFDLNTANHAAEELRQALAEAALDALLDKMAENAKELGLDYMEGSAEQYEKVLEQPAPEPDPDELTIAYMSGLYDGKKRKPWVGLTDEEIRDWWRIENGLEDCNMAKLVDFTLAVRAIEAKLKEKNTSGKATEKGGAA